MATTVSDERAACYRVGLCHASVCAVADATPEEITRAAGPTGLDHGWQISEEPTFSGGEPNPCPCNVDPSRQHWLLVC
jgi:hypothetical protein